jgi:hypothetical protein
MTQALHHEQSTATQFGRTGVASIDEHEGNKYLRTIRSARADDDRRMQVDVYCVIDAFEVKCPGRQQAIKKLLCTGTRGKGDEMADLMGALAALNRAIE